MSMPHMRVHIIHTFEDSQAHPTQVRLAHRTRHMITPRILLDRHLAPRTLLHIVLSSPLLEEIVPGARLRTCQPIMRISVAARADPNKTRRALDERASWRRAVHL